MRQLLLTCLKLVIVAVPAAAGTVGCSGKKELRCNPDTAYQAASSSGQLRIPDDLNVPDETESLRIPDVLPRVDDGAEPSGCLEESPAFSERE